MLSFHVGQNEAIEKDTLATMRLNFGKDENSSDKLFDTVFWSIAAGLKLYDAANSGKTSASDLNFSSNNAFANRPIEIPGGIGSLSFEVVKHSEPKWYQRIFRFLGGNAGATLVSLLGFPAVSIHGIRAIDELLERLKDEPPLFESSPLRFAMSGFSRDEFTGGDQNVKIGVLAKGYNVFARGRDIERFNNQPMTYYAHLNRLAPRDASESNVLANQFDDPLADVTYAIFKVGLAETKLDPTFDFRNG